jgi:hypothetical protein
MASSNIDWICGQCTHKNEGSSEPGPCHFCQTPHPKRKAVVVSVPTSASPAKSVRIRQPARSSGSVSALPAKPVCIGQPAHYSGYDVIDLSDPDAAQAVASAASLAKAVSIRPSAPCSSDSVIDLSAPDEALAVAFALPAKPVFIRQPAPPYSSSVIDLSAPDGALALASTLPAKPVFIRQPAPPYSGSAVIDLSAPDGALASASTSPAKPVFGQSSSVVKENRVLADQNHALAIVVGQMKSREIEAAHKCRALEESQDRLSLVIDDLKAQIDDLKAQLANNNADLISYLRETITSLDEAAEVASWTDWRQSEEIRRLEGIVDSENISRMEESIDWERSRNCKLREENCHLSGEVGRLQFQINNMRASRPAAGVDNYLSDDNLSLFPSSDDDGSN